MESKQLGITLIFSEFRYIQGNSLYLGIFPIFGTFTSAIRSCLHSYIQWNFFWVDSLCETIFLCQTTFKAQMQFQHSTFDFPLNDPFPNSELFILILGGCPKGSFTVMKLGHGQLKLQRAAYKTPEGSSTSCHERVKYAGKKLV